jgi:hypothetical protein
MARKPKLPIGDDLARLLKLALAGAKGPAKKTQANRIVSKLESKGNPAVSGMRTKAGKMEQQLVRGKVKRREVESISADADKHMQRMAKQGKNWDGSPVKKATKPRKAASKKLTVAEEIAAARRILAQREMGKKVIKAQERTLRATRLGDAAAAKGTKKGRGGKEIPMSKKEVKKVVRQGNLAGSQRAKGNAKKKADQLNLQARMQNAPDAASKRAARNKLRKHQDTHGNFLG